LFHRFYIIVTSNIWPLLLAIAVVITGAYNMDMICPNLHMTHLRPQCINDKDLMAYPTMMLKSLAYDIIVPDDRNELYSYRKISLHSMNEFQTSLSYEIWENVFSTNDNDSNTIFNNFLNTFLRKFYASFSKKEQNLCRTPKLG
jgi:hypothetical protein